MIDIKKVKPDNTLDEIPGAVLKVHMESSDRDIYSENNRSEDFEIPVVLNANRRIPVLCNDMFIQKIVSENEVIVHFNGHWGGDVVVNNKETAHFHASDSYGYNDNFCAFSLDVTMELSELPHL